jgi:hypothetical protein
MRPPLHEEYAARMRSRIADLVSSAEKRMPRHAGTPKIRRVRRRSLSSRVTRSRRAAIVVAAVAAKLAPSAHFGARAEDGGSHRRGTKAGLTS